MRERKTALLQVRMTPTLKDRIEQRARAMGLNTSDYVRASLATNALETLVMRDGLKSPRGADGPERLQEAMEREEESDGD
jgi:hypothetical protein